MRREIATVEDHAELARCIEEADEALKTLLRKSGRFTTKKMRTRLWSARSCLDAFMGRCDWMLHNDHPGVEYDPYDGCIKP